ncbi:MAG: hypothetical protein MRZ79_13845 [Bacteroidia bacterium]|nr:hypothetical protein [Bacteroidia bacterium]
MRYTLALLITLCICSCYPNKGQKEPARKFVADSIIFSSYSSLQNTYKNFNSPKAINRIAKIENEYFRNYDGRGSKYYGTVWREQAELHNSSITGQNLFTEFHSEFNLKGDSMHCTIYAVEALMAGMSEKFEELEKSHRRIWKGREHAGWSIGYLLVKEWNWDAYLIIDPESEEFAQCKREFLSKKVYPVWRQPDIPLKRMLIIGQDDSLITQLLSQHEFGWGFSHQGIHTWITRFDQLKECNWLGAPGKKYEITSKSLFLKTDFLKYKDYASHVVIFPPKEKFP